MGGGSRDAETQTQKPKYRIERDELVEALRLGGFLIFWEIVSLADISPVCFAVGVEEG